MHKPKFVWKMWSDHAGGPSVATHTFVPLDQEPLSFFTEHFVPKLSDSAAICGKTDAGPPCIICVHDKPASVVEAVAVAGNDEWSRSEHLYEFYRRVHMVLAPWVPSHYLVPEYVSPDSDSIRLVFSGAPTPATDLALIALATEFDYDVTVSPDPWHHQVTSLFTRKPGYGAP